jgi:type II secretory pathway component PulK
MILIRTSRIIRKRLSRQGHPCSERGIVLVIVIWVLAFVGIVLSAFAFAMRTELDAARNFKEEAEASALAEAGVAMALAELAHPGTTDRAAGIVPPYDSGEIRLGRGSYRVVVTDETGRIALNGASAEVLRRLLRNSGVRDARLLDTLVDAILDWQDFDNVPRANGAEEEYYRSLSHPYRAKSGAFESLEELLLVRGMTRDILLGNVAAPGRRADMLARTPEERDLRPGEYLGILPFLTVSGAGQVNRGSAGLDVLLALGLSAGEAQAILDARHQAALGDRLSGAIQGRSPAGGVGRLRIESIGTPGGSRISYRITAIVAKEGARIPQRSRVLSWREGA